MKQRYISSEDINSLFHSKKRKRRFPSWQVLSACFVIVFGIFFLINAPAITQQLSYWYETDIQNSQSLTQTISEEKKAPGIPVASPTGIDTIKQPVVTVATDLSKINDNSIYIPKIKVKAPIIWDVSAGGDLNTDMLTALRYGVVRYPQTALPSQVGNVFLTGHSSNYWWEKGNYKTIFALLDRLVVGDMIYIKYNGIVYTYKVAGQRVVKPSETSVLNSTKAPTLSLMTCTPTGTALYRRIVTANLVSPTEGLTQQPTSPTNGSLQAVR